jgi:chemotaxis-related protein WspD
MNPLTPEVEENKVSLHACWKEIGVWGKRDCPELQQVGHCHNCQTFTRAARLLQDRPIPAGYREEWTRHLAAPLVSRQQDTASWLVFLLGTEQLALPLGTVTEVMEERPIHRLPHRKNPVVRGLVNVRGELVVCVSLEALLGIESGAVNPQARRRIMVLSGEGGRYCCFTEEIKGTRAIAAAEHKPLPATVNRAHAHFTESIVMQDKVVIGCLKPARLFSALNEAVK